MFVYLENASLGQRVFDLLPPHDLDLAQYLHRKRCIIVIAAAVTIAADGCCRTRSSGSSGRGIGRSGSGVWAEATGIRWSNKEDLAKASHEESINQDLRVEHVQSDSPALAEHFQDAKVLYRRCLLQIAD